MFDTFKKPAAIVGIVAGTSLGSYGIASAASGSSSSSTTRAAAQNPWGNQRGDETLLTGTTEEKVRAVALDEVPGGTIVRVETDADGHAAYEAHMTKAEGTPVTVYVDTSYNVVSVETR
jgi:uncharacterized membrane protein YkoI